MKKFRICWAYEAGVDGKKDRRIGEEFFTTVNADRARELTVAAVQKETSWAGDVETEVQVIESLPTKILIIDTQGEAITPIYRSLLPGVKMRGIETDATRGTPCHEHGALCGWLTALPCIGAGIEIELVFCRMFDTDARPIANANQFILDTIAAERPDYISRSWGAWDFDSPLGRQFAEEMFADFLPRFIELQKDIGFLDFGAAGNSDKNDADQDVDAPQCMLPATVIVGACGKNGVAMEWSGDGVGVACVMWADRVYSPDMSGRFVLWSGTSAATPKLCGACAALGYTTFEQVMKVLTMSERPDGVWELPHPKWGQGCAENLWQNQARRVPPGLFPPYHQLTVQGIERIEFFDFRRLEETERPEIQETKPTRKTGRVKNADQVLAGAVIMNRAFTPPTDGWYHLAPFGEFKGKMYVPGKEEPEDVVQVIDRDALTTVLNAFAERSKADPHFPGLLVDFEHFSHDPDQKTEAAAWIKNLEIRDDGLYGKFELTNIGRAAIEGGSYRFISPTFDVETVTKNRVRPIELTDSAFTNKPNLRGLRPLSNRGSAWSRNNNQPDVASSDASAGKSGKSMNYKEMLCQSLGLPADATDEQIKAAMDAKAQEVKNRTAEFEKLQTRVQDMEKKDLETEAAAFCDKHAAVIQNRADVIKQYVENKAVTIALFGAVKPAATTFNRSAATTPAASNAAKIDLAAKQHEAVHKIMNRDKVKFSAAWPIAMKENPDLFVEERPGQDK